MLKNGRLEFTTSHGSKLTYCVEAKVLTTYQEGGIKSECLVNDYNVDIDIIDTTRKPGYHVKFSRYDINRDLILALTIPVPGKTEAFKLTVFFQEVFRLSKIPYVHKDQLL